MPAGSYSAAVLTISANPGDLLLTVGANPESGFPVPAGTSIPASQIQLQGKQGSAGSLTVPVTVTFDSPLVVSTTQSNALDLEFDLANPAFIMGHTPPSAAGTTLWAVNFNGPVRHRAVHEIARLVLRHTYGTVNSVASDNLSFAMSKDFPVLPVTNPETAVSSAQSLEINVDSTNGTIFYDLDAKTRTVVKDLAAQAGMLTGRYVRVAARYQQNGSLVAVRVWASTDFAKVWLSPEGHVLHVDPAANLITVADESGRAVPVAVDENTQFFYRTPQDAQADATPIATGAGFLAADQLARGFKVHVSAVDPLATPLVAQSIDIETAAYSGRISAAGSSGFTYTHQFVRASDDYSVALSYIAAATANGSDASGNAVAGFKWWNFTFPTLAESGANAVTDFVTATNGAVNFGGTVGAQDAWGLSTVVLGRPCESFRLVGPQRRAAADAGAAGGGYAAAGQQCLRHHSTRRHAAGDGGGEHCEWLSDAGVPDRSQRGHCHGQPGRCVECERARHPHQRACHRRARQGVRHTPGRWHAQGLRARLLHRHAAEHVAPQSFGPGRKLAWKKGVAGDPRGALRIDAAVRAGARFTVIMGGCHHKTPASAN